MGKVQNQASRSAFGTRRADTYLVLANFNENPYPSSYAAITVTK